MLDSGVWSGYVREKCHCTVTDLGQSKDSTMYEPCVLCLKLYKSCQLIPESLCPWI
jgi:hypothetical protein